jgi:hypothetical protein
LAVSEGKTRGKRRFIIWGLAITALLVVIAVYETNKELKRHEETRADGGSSEGINGGDIPVEKAQVIIHGYYRSHDLPIGWKVAEIEIAAPSQLEVTLYFAPRIGDSRHGKGAPPGDITTATGCPIDTRVMAQITRYSLRILVHDKTGLIDNFPC